MAVIFNLSKKEIEAVRKAAVYYYFPSTYKSVAWALQASGLAHAELEIDVQPSWRLNKDSAAALKKVLRVVKGDGPKVNERRIHLLSLTKGLSREKAKIRVY